MPPTSCTSFRPPSWTPPSATRSSARSISPPPAACTAATRRSKPTRAQRDTTPTNGYPSAYEQAADWLEHASAAVDPPALIDHAQQAGRYAAVAIGSLDRNAPNATEAITDTLAHLLAVCVFADTAPTNR